MKCHRRFYKAPGPLAVLPFSIPERFQLVMVSNMIFENPFQRAERIKVGHHWSFPFINIHTVHQIRMFQLQWWKENALL